MNAGPPLTTQPRCLFETLLSPPKKARKPKKKRSFRPLYDAFPDLHSKLTSRETGSLDTNVNEHRSVKCIKCKWIWKSYSCRIKLSFWSPFVYVIVNCLPLLLSIGCSFSWAQFEKPVKQFNQIDRRTLIPANGHKQRITTLWLSWLNRVTCSVPLDWSIRKQQWSRYTSFTCQLAKLRFLLLRCVPHYEIIAAF